MKLGFVTILFAVLEAILEEERDEAPEPTTERIITKCKILENSKICREEKDIVTDIFH